MGRKYPILDNHVKEDIIIETLHIIENRFSNL